jgi:hypothetical protein
MKLYGVISLHVHGEEVMRDPRFVDKLKRAFGGTPDLRSGRTRAALEATAVVDGVRDAMRRLGVTNAIALVIDETVLFHDTHAQPDDLGDLFLAFHDNAPVFGTGFDELRLTVEHREGDLHLVAEVQARSEHPREEAAVRVVVSARIAALTPRPGEDADAFRARATPVASDKAALALYEAQFATFVGRMRDALAVAMPTARVEIEVAEPRIVRPQAQAPRPQSPDARNYDPYEAYYPTPLGMVANAFLWSTLFSMAIPPHVTVVDAANHVEGHTDDAGIETGATEPGGDAGEAWWQDSGGDDSGFDFGGWDFGGTD